MIHALQAATHGPASSRAVLTAQAHEAVEEIHAPREAGVAGTGSRRPGEGEGRRRTATGQHRGARHTVGVKRP